MHAHHGRARNADAQPRSDQMVERADAQRADADAVEALVEGGPQLERVARVAALGREEADRGAADALRREREDAAGRRVEPLRVIDRDEHPRVVRERAKVSEERARHCELIRRLRGCRLGADRHGERATLRFGKLVGDLGQVTFEQITYAAERERHLCLRAASRENADAVVFRLLERSTPKRRLADTGLALDHERAGVLVETGHEVPYPRPFGLPSDEFHRSRIGHPAILSRIELDYQRFRRRTVGVSETRLGARGGRVNQTSHTPNRRGTRRPEPKGVEDDAEHRWLLHECRHGA